MTSRWTNHCAALLVAGLSSACTPGGEGQTSETGQTTGAGPGGESSGDVTGAQTGDAPTTGGATDGATGGDTGDAPTGPYAACGEGLVDPRSGEIDAALYKQLAEDWSKEAIDCRLGPTWEELHGGDSTNDAAEVWGPEGMICDGGYLTVGIPVQEGVCPAGGGCYGSVSGQVVYVPDGGVSPAAPGVDRVQTHAWEQGAISSHPKLLDSPEPFLKRPEYNTPPLGQPIAVTRSERNWSNDGYMIFSDGTVATGGTATSGSHGALYRFPAHLKPSAIAVTSNNEFVLVTLWNTQEIRGELAVLSVRAPTPSAHAWWYHGLYNVGGVRELKFLGTIPLPFATPTSVSAVTTRGWTNPNDANGKLMAQLSFTGPDKQTDADRCYTDVSQMKDPNVSQPISAFTGDGWLHHLIARKGYAIVGSQWEDKVAFVDLRPLLDYYASMYFGSEASCTETLSQFVWDKMQPGDQVLSQAPPDVWPYTFDIAPESSRPTIAAVFDVTAPRSVRAGPDKSDKIYGPNSGVDVWKAYAAGDDGTLHVFTPGEMMASWFELGQGTQQVGPPAAVSTVPICEHPTTLVMHRGLVADRAQYPDIAPEKIGDQVQMVSGMNDGVIVVCRGERKLQHVIHWQGAGEVYEEIVDSRMNDPVAVWYSDRADVRTVTDFNGKKILSYRFGAVKIEDWEQGCGPQGAVYGPGIDGMSDLEFSGELTFAGFPFSVTAANVN